MKTYEGIRIIGVDTGYGNIKTANSIIPTGITPYDREPTFAGRILKMDGKWYGIGTGHKAYRPNKNVDDDFYLLTLAAMAEELDAFGLTKADVHLAIGLPLTWFRIQKEEHYQYMMRKKDLSYQYNDKQYEIHLVGCNVFPQGYAAIVPLIDQNPSEYAGTVVLADIGNGTLNTMYLQDCKPNELRCYTEELGVKQCVTAAKKTLMDRFAMNATENEIQPILLKQPGTLAEEYTHCVRETAEQYVIGIFDSLQAHGYDPRMMRLVITGGGGVLVKNFGKYDPDRVTILDDLRVNARGYEYLAQGRLWNLQQTVR